MEKPRGGWSRGPAKTAAQHDVRYGRSLLNQESLSWPPYFAVSSPSAYKAAHRHLGRQPKGVAHARLLDWSHLQEITDNVPDGAELIVGIGGGVALDASKYVALKRELPLILVPTIASTGAIIHSVFAKWEDHKTIGPSETWPWIDFDHAVVDYDLVLEAPYYLNTAGLGDVLCGYSGMCEWRRNSRLGIGEPWDESAATVAAQLYDHIVTEFPKTLKQSGELTADSVRFIVKAIQSRDEKTLRHPAAPMADHSFWLGAEEINNKGWIHGEFVALAAVIIAWHCEEGVETVKGWLDTCKVRWHPSEIGVSRGELRKALEYAPRFLSDRANERDVPSILLTEPIAGTRFNALWKFLATT